MRAGLKQTSIGLLCALGLVLGLVAPAAQAAFDDPIFIYRPEPPQPPAPPIPPPVGYFEGPCGLAVDESGDFYVSDYYHHAIDAFAFDKSYLGQIANEDPLDGPCGLAIGAGGAIYVNNYHRNVVRFDSLSATSAATIAGVGATPAAPEDSPHPTGVALDRASGDVYVDEGTQVGIYDAAGALLQQLGAFGEGYGIAVSEYGPTEGLVYVPDAANDTVLVFDPASLSPSTPVATIDGSVTPAGQFGSLRDSSIAVDRVSGEIYVADNLNPEYTYHPQAVVYVFDPAGTYKGRLKHGFEDALPIGLAVDNSPTATQGRVYVTSGNSELAAVYAYPPGAATSAAVPLPGAPALAPSGGSGFSAGPPAPVPASAAAAPASAAAAPASAGAFAQEGAAVPPLAAAKALRASRAERRDRARHKAKHRAAKRPHGSQKGPR